MNANRYNTKKARIFVSDPAQGLVKFSEDEFKKCWLAEKTGEEEKGIALVLEPTEEFYKKKDEYRSKLKLTSLIKYVIPFKKQLSWLVVFLLIGSIIQIAFPFLSQSLVDKGISGKNIPFIYLILSAQLALYAGQTTVGLFRSWVLLRVSTKVNIKIISDFLTKLMKLPVGFFDTKMTGDLIQRISDNNRIQNFLTTTSLNILFSVFSLFVFGGILLFYSWRIFFIFITGSVLYAIWIWFFMKRRREIDNRRFAMMASNQSNIIQLITGMQEIKLNNCEKSMLSEWETIQEHLYETGVKNMKIGINQQMGSVFINEVKNIIISFLSAVAVIKGDMTIGMMLSVQYIIGQLNSPVEQMLTFMQSAQDAKLSLERLEEVHKMQNEEENDGEKVKNNEEHHKVSLAHTKSSLPENKSIRIENVYFRYDFYSDDVLKNITLTIPENKTTAIVGASGSGKTTLLKLLLGFYQAQKGTITVGNELLQNFKPSFWRSACGAVMQDGFIFSESIAKNIALSQPEIEEQRLQSAAATANIEEYVKNLPLGFRTKIGQEGVGLSQGQRQRILIARAVYKNPEFVFFDEATNALDAGNEKIIMNNLDEFLKNKTVVIVAHRLSTVKNADQIVVLEKGEIVETGTHAELTDLKGKYYALVKNQLELGT